MLPKEQLSKLPGIQKEASHRLYRIEIHRRRTLNGSRAIKILNLIGAVAKLRKSSMFSCRTNKNPRLFTIESPWIFVHYASFATAPMYVDKISRIFHIFQKSRENLYFNSIIEFLNCQ